MSRRENDAYDSPDALAHAIVERIRRFVAYVPGAVEPNILEPTAGGGAFVRACRATWPDSKIAAVDIDPGKIEGLRAAGALAALDADILAVPSAHIAPARLIIGNPPYRQAEEILIHLLDAVPLEGPAPALVAMLLPVGFLGSKGRHAPGGVFHSYPLRYLAPIVPRPSFTNDGKTDRMEYALFGWGDSLPRGIDNAITWEK